MDPEATSIEKEMDARFRQLPKVVQDAISSATVEQHLRELANAHKLHLDQWTTLENEVMFALLGIEPVSDLAKNIENEVRVDGATASALAADISKIVFAPIRGELERILEHPEAQAQQQSDIDTARTEMLAQEQTASTTPDPAVRPAAQTTPTAPSAPPEPAPTQKVERASISSTYAPGAPSHERKAIEGDPYREPIL